MVKNTLFKNSIPQTFNQIFCYRIERQKVVQISPDENRALFTTEDEKAREQSTKDILKKIEQVNLSHGFTPRNIPGRRPIDEKSKQMNYHPYMFQNPVWNYLQREPNTGLRTKIEEGDKHETETVPKGHYIKRKITHKQTYLVPNTPQMMSYLEPPFLGPEPFFDPVDLNKSGNLTESEESTLAKQQFLINNIKNIVSSSQGPQPYSNSFNSYFPNIQPYQQYNQYMPYPHYQNQLRTPGYNPNFVNGPFSDSYFANMQTMKPYDPRNSQTYDETKDYGNQDISSQTIKFPNGQNSFRPSMRFPGSRQESPRPKNPIITANDNSEIKYVRLPDIPKPEQPKQFGPYQSLPDQQILRQFVPSSNYYPMNPPEPFKGVYSSITSMVEYGQKDENCDKEKKGNSVVAVRSGKGISFDEFDLELLKFLEDVMKSVEQEEEEEEDEGKEDKIDEDEITTEEITTEGRTTTEPELTTINDPVPVVRVGREVNLNSDKGKKLLKLLENIREEESKNGPKGIIKYLERVINETSNQSSEESAFELEGIEIIEDDKKSKKMSGKLRRPSKDKPGDDDKFYEKSGTGIFINRLKVRKGGVAIAGPGGIATAGSGGTAIVGPNGVAYTQPNGVAIAGPGTRVYAVDPSVDLNKFVQNLTKNEEISARIGKVVAIGPVVYYNTEDKV